MCCPKSGGQQESVAKPKTCGLAIASLIFGLLILFPLLGIFFGLFAIITGIGGLVRIDMSKGRLIGKNLAMAGIILGIMGIIFYPRITWMERPLILRLPRTFTQSVTRYTGMGMMICGSIRSRVSRVKSDLRSIAMALEAYYNDHNSYPAWAKGDGGANNFAGPQAGAFYIHTFRIWQDDTEVGKFATLTTPVAYLPSYPRDPFAWTRGATYGYYADENGWILYSWGPDKEEGLKYRWDLEPDVELVYKSTISQPSLTLISGTSSSSSHEAYTYDPTNGTYSAGDIWRVKQ